MPRTGYIELVEHIERVLDEAEERVARGDSVDGIGFWPLVKQTKSDPELVETYGRRIADIDQEAFRNWAFLAIPVVPGTILALAGTAVGLGLVGWAYWLVDWAAVITFYAGVGVVLVTTHGLAHLAVGRLSGMRFTHWFIGTLGRPQPGVKVDYESYLRSRAESRAWMHASGAIVTKIVPFVMIGASVAAGLPMWVPWVLVALGVVSILTDVLWSTKASDWKKFRREMALA